MITIIGFLDLPALQSLADFDVSTLLPSRITLVPGEGHVCPRRDRRSLGPRPHRRNKTKPKSPAFSPKAFHDLAQFGASREHGKPENRKVQQGPSPSDAGIRRSSHFIVFIAEFPGRPRRAVGKKRKTKSATRS
jgi:hypothetical protein